MEEEPTMDKTFDATLIYSKERCFYDRASWLKVTHNNKTKRIANY